MHGGFEVWLLNGCGPNLCFPKAFEQSTRFPWRKSGDVSPYFREEIRNCLALGDMDCDNYIGRGQAGIYIHTSCTMQAHRVGK